MNQILDDQWSLIIPTNDHIKKSMMTLSSIWSSMPKKMIDPKTDVYIQQLVKNAKNGWLIIPQKTDVSLSQADLECREKCKWSSKFSQKITHKLISQADIECREEESGNQADSCQCWEEQVMVVIVMVIWKDGCKKKIYNKKRALSQSYFQIVGHGGTSWLPWRVMPRLSWKSLRQGFVHE